MKSKILLSISESDANVAFLTLPGHAGPTLAGSSVKQTRLRDLLAYGGT